MAITLVNSAVTVFVGPNNITFDVSSWGLQAGDLMVAAGVHAGSSGFGDIVTSGYTQRAQASWWIFSNRFRAFTKKMGPAPDTEVVCQGAGPSGGGAISGYAIAALRGTHSNSPIDAAATVANGASGSPDPASITTTMDNSAIITFGVVNTLDGMAVPSGYDDLGYDDGDQTSVDLALRAAWTIKPVAGAEDPLEFAATTSGQWSAITLSIKELIPFTGGSGAILMGL